MQKPIQTALALAAALFTAVLPVPAGAAGALDLNLPSLGSSADAGLSPQDEYRLGTQIMAEVRADPTRKNFIPRELFTSIVTMVASIP